MCLEDMMERKITQTLESLTLKHSNGLKRRGLGGIHLKEEMDILLHWSVSILIS